MNRFFIQIDAEALTDIQEIADWYEAQKEGLGYKFKTTVIEQIDRLTNNPQLFAIGYKEIRFMLVKKFPYMVHFYINRETFTVEILAVISTDRNPKIWQEKTKKI